MSIRPFRIHLQGADPERLHAASLAVGRQDDPYLPFTKERALIDHWTRKEEHPPLSLLSRWVHHPDERVRWLIITRPAPLTWLTREKSPITAQMLRDLRKNLIERAFADAAAAGFSWTPLVDELACSIFFPIPLNMIDESRTILSRWFEEYATTKDLREALRTFRYRPVVAHILENARSMDWRLIRDIATLPEAYFPEGSLEFVARNRFLSASLVAKLTKQLVDDWESLVKGETHIFTNSAPWYPLVDLLRSHPDVFPIDELRRLYSVLRQTEEERSRSASRSAKSAKERAKDDSLEHYGVYYLSSSIADEKLPVPSDVLMSLLPYLTKDPTYFKAALQHPNADRNLLRAAVRINQRPYVQEIVARDVELRWDPKIREILLKSAHDEVLAILAEDADSEMAGRLISHLILHYRYKLAVQALRARSPKQPISLSEDHLLRLLHNPDSEIRLSTVACLDRISPDIVRSFEVRPTHSKVNNRTHQRN